MISVIGLSQTSRVESLLLRAVRRTATLILTKSRGYICVCNLDFFHLVGNDLRYVH